MKLLPGTWKLGLFPKLLLTFLLVLTPLYYIGLRINQTGSEHITSEISDSLSSRADLYTGILDTDFRRIRLLLQEYVNDEDLLKLSNASGIMTDIEKTQAILRLKSRLDLLKSTSGFVEKAMVFIPSMDRMVTSNDTAITGFDPLLYGKLLKEDLARSTPFELVYDKAYIALPYPSPSLSTHPIFLLAVEISRTALSETLMQFTANGGGAVLTDRNSHWQVSGSPDPVLGEMLLREADSLPIGSGHAETVRIGDLKYLAVSKGSDMLDVRLTMVVPIQRLDRSLQSFRHWLVVLSAASLVLVILFSYSVYRIILRPVKTLVQSFRKVEQGRFDLSLTYPYRDEYGFLYDRFNSTVRQLGVLVHEVYEQQYRTRLAELRHLQSQINPHFLYNTYFILYRMVTLQDYENVLHLTRHLGEYFQYITRDGQEDVELEKEVKHAVTYTEIQSVRFGGRIRTEVEEVPDEARRVPVPRLLLQPILENAYKHALENNPRGGWLRLAFTVEGKFLRILVEDSGHGLTEEKLSELRVMLLDREEPVESTGMVNVHRRLRIKYGEPAGLILGMGADGGLRVELTIPMEEEERT